MPAHIVYGDSFLTRHAVERIMADAGMQKTADYSHQQLQAAQTDVNQLINACNVMTFLEKGRLVTAEGILATQERGQRQTEPHQSQRKQTRNEWSRLADAIPNMPVTTILVLIDEKVSTTNRLLKNLSPHCTVHDEQAPSGAKLRRWILDNVQKRNSQIQDQAAQILEETIGNDLWTLDREIEKLSLYCGENVIRAQDVQLVVDKAKEANIFAAVDAIIERQPGKALQMMARLMADGTDPMNLMGMINRQLRLMALAVDLSQRGVPHHQWDKSLGFASEFVARKTASQVRNRTMADVRRMYEQSLQADLDIKQGIREPKLAVELLTATLSRT